MIRSVLYFVEQAIKLSVVVGPAIVPEIAAYLQYRKGNPNWWFWLIGGLVMAAGLVRTLRHYGRHMLWNL